MAKKVVASLQKAESKNLAKVIMATRSAKTGAYGFQERIVSLEEAKEMVGMGEGKG
ncbi:MAG: DUF4295 domain-containing protein [Bacteroidota bacterium]